MIYETDFGVAQKDKVEVCPECGSENKPKYIGTIKDLLRPYSTVYCPSTWHLVVREKRHAFTWYCKGWERVNRYGDVVEEPEVLGASVKEAREILIKGLEQFIGDIYKDYYVPRGLLPTEVYSPAPSNMPPRRRWLPWL